MAALQPAAGVSPNAEKEVRAPDAPVEKPAKKAATMKPMVSPSNWLSYVTMWYLNNLLWMGSRRPLMPEDLGHVLPGDSCEQLTRDFQRHWAAEVARAAAANAAAPTRKKKAAPSMNVALAKTLGPAWAFAILCYFVSAGLTFLPPLILQQLVGYLEGEPLSTAKAWRDVVALLLIPIVSTYLQNVHNNIMARCVDLEPGVGFAVLVDCGGGGGG
jgi:hypothetical protein